MRKPQRNWMLEESVEWNDTARSLDWDMSWYAKEIEHPDLVETRELLNSHEGLRSVMLFVHARRWEEIERLRVDAKHPDSK